MVFHGKLENGTEVAVKMRSESSSQEAKEFLAEVTDRNIVRTLILNIHRLQTEGMIDIDGNLLEVLECSDIFQNGSKLECQVCN